MSNIVFCLSLRFLPQFPSFCLCCSSHFMDPSWQQIPFSLSSPSAPSYLFIILFFLLIVHFPPLSSPHRFTVTIVTVATHCVWVTLKWPLSLAAVSETWFDWLHFYFKSSHSGSHEGYILHHTSWHLDSKIKSSFKKPDASQFTITRTYMCVKMKRLFKCTKGMKRKWKKT